MLKCVLIFIVLASLVSCRSKKQLSETDRVIQEAISRFPQLLTSTNNRDTSFQLIRSVKIGKKNIELQLYSSSEYLNDPQSILVIINDKKIAFAIPLLSNTYRDYWNFQFENSNMDLLPVNTTFEKELKDCIQKLQLNDSHQTDKIVIKEMLTSLMGCFLIDESDSVNLVGPVLSDTHLKGVENVDSCAARNQKSWTEIKTAFHPREYISEYNAFWDKRNKRIYHFFYQSGLNKSEFYIRTYRLDCIFRFIYL